MIWVFSRYRTSAMLQNTNISFASFDISPACLPQPCHWLYPVSKKTNTSFLFFRNRCRDSLKHLVNTLDVLLLVPQVSLKDLAKTSKISCLQTNARSFSYQFDNRKERCSKINWMALSILYRGLLEFLSEAPDAI